jgi:ABC-type uncharacterized transport system permease subunit
MKASALLRSIAPPAGIVAAAVVVTLAAKANPVTAYGALLQGAVGSVQGLAETLAQTTILLFASLGVAVAFRAGLFNIGAEGQLVVGALAAAVTGADLALPKPLEVPLCFAAGAAAGAAWAFIAGWLKARYGASEVITTIMLNYIAYLGADYAVTGPLRGSRAAPETAPIAASAVLHPLVPDTRLTAAFPLALLVAGAAWWWLFRTVWGYEVRVLGRSERVARYAGISPPGVIMTTMSIAGACAGLGGAAEVLSMLHRFNAQLSPGYGFTSIAAALVGQSNPLGVVVSTFFFGILQNGALSMQALAGVPKDLVSVITGLAILLAAVNLFGRRATLQSTAPAEPPEPPVDLSATHA